MTEQVFFDEILQIFLSNGNYHIILGRTSGEISVDGKDIKKPVLTLIVPENRLIESLPALTEATSQLSHGTSPKRLDEKNQDTKKLKESYEGEPLIFKYNPD